MKVFNYSAKTISGKEESLEQYKGNILLIVNTASKCGFTPQLKGLQQLYEQYKDKGFYVLGFPCNQFASQEPLSNDAINDFCQKNYGVTFPMFSKIDVKGPNAHPLFQFLTGQTSGFLTSDIKWNFTKFLIDRDGNVVERFTPQTTPEKIAKRIEDLL